MSKVMIEYSWEDEENIRYLYGALHNNSTVNILNKEYYVEEIMKNESTHIGRYNVYLKEMKR